MPNGDREVENGGFYAGPREGSFRVVGEPQPEPIPETEVDRSTILDRLFLVGDEEKKAYREAVREKTLDALDKFAEKHTKEDEGEEDYVVAHIRYRIYEAMKNESLFRLIHGEMKRLQEKYPDRSDLCHGLKNVQGVLTSIAGKGKDGKGGADIFSTLKTEIGDLQKADWGGVRDILDDIDEERHERDAIGELGVHSKATPDFGGMPTAWINGVGFWMNYAEKKANERWEGLAGNLERASEWNEVAKRLLNGDIKYQTWGTANYDLTNLAYKHIVELKGEPKPQQVQPAEQTVQAGLTVDDIASGVARGRRQEKEESEISAEDEYLDFLDEERWCEGEVDFEKNESVLYKSLGRKERAQLLSRITLRKAVDFKKRSVVKLEHMLANAELGKITFEMVRDFYETPGVRQALETYVELAHTNKKILELADSRGRRTKIGFLECSGKNQVNWFRGHVQGGIANTMVENSGGQDVDEQKIERASLEAEQIAYNLLLAANTFEALDAKWNKDKTKRERGFTATPAVYGMVLNTALRKQMNPIDGVLALLEKPSGKEVPIGALSEWTVKQIKRALGTLGRRNFRGFDEVEMVDPNKRSSYWRASKQKLSMPRIYPVQLIGSYWEETQVGGKNMLDYLMEKEEIPFDQGGSGFQAYLVGVSYADALWSVYEGSRGKLANISSDWLWMEETNKILGDVGLRDNEETKRLLFYAREGVDPNSSLPKINVAKRAKKQTAIDFSTESANYLPRKKESKSKEVYFSWDRK